MIDVRRLSKHYARGNWYSRPKTSIVALDNVDLTIEARSTLALVGESGAGKSTLGLCLARLEQPDSGEIWFQGQNLLALGRAWLSDVRAEIQFVFQDSGTAMNPRFSAAEVVREGLDVQGRLPKKARQEEALAIMQKMGISPDDADRSPLEFSGGQRQRLAIARALILKPSFLIFDEALSGLDLPIQAEILELLLHLQSSLSLTYLFITHDIPVAARIADRIAVMWRGKIVESGRVSEIMSHPQHPYTRSLLAATPKLGTRPSIFNACGG